VLLKYFTTKINHAQFCCGSLSKVFKQNKPEMSNTLFWFVAKFDENLTLLVQKFGGRKKFVINKFLLRLPFKWI